MSRTDRTRTWRTTAAVGALAGVSLAISCASRTEGPWRDENLPQPGSVTIDDSVKAPQARRATRAAQLYYAFWDTGLPEYAETAVAQGFIDDSLPEGFR